LAAGAAFAAGFASSAGAAGIAAASVAGLSEDDSSLAAGAVSSARAVWAAPSAMAIAKQIRYRNFILALLKFATLDFLFKLVDLRLK
jgi:hypothetical protein